VERVVALVRAETVLPHALSTDGLLALKARGHVEEARLFAAHDARHEQAAYIDHG